MFSSAISLKYLSTSKFSKDNKIAPARRAGAICGLWEKLQVLITPNSKITRVITCK